MTLSVPDSQYDVCMRSLLALILCSPALLAQQLPDRDAWPHRITTRDGSLGVVRELTLPPGPPAMVRVGEITAGHKTDLDRTDASALLDALPESEAGREWTTEGSGAMVLRDWPREHEEATPFDADAHYVFISAPHAPPDEPLAIQRTWFAYYEPFGEVADPPALAVMIPGMFGTPEPIIQQLVTGLRQRGWHVLLMVAQPSRFTESLTVGVDPSASPAAQIEPIARLIDDRFAECAYAVEGVTAHLALTRPEAPTDRRFAVGFSAGALAMPAVIAREPEAYEAALLMGGGADMLTMVLTSNYADWIDALHIEWKTTPTDEQFASLIESYREQARLDPYALAPSMKDTPSLLVMGSNDQAVPAELGELYWARAGEPERRLIPAGHELLFFGYIRARAADLLDWLESAVR